MAQTKQTAWQGAGRGKQLVTFLPNTDSANDEDSDQSTGSGGKAVRIAKQLATIVTIMVAARRQSSRYYQPPAAIRDSEGEIRRCKPGTIALASLRWYKKSVSMLILLLPFSQLVREIAEDQKK